MKTVLIAALAAGALSLAGCSASIGGPDYEGTLEKSITNELPKKLKESGQAVITINKVTCKAVSGSDSKFDCVASISGTDNKGKKGSGELQIAGTCADDKCNWETK